MKSSKLLTICVGFTLVSYIYLNSKIPDVKAVEVENVTREAVVNVAPQTSTLQHYRIDDRLISLFEIKGVLQYGRINPMQFENLEVNEHVYNDVESVNESPEFNTESPEVNESPEFNEQSSDGVRLLPPEDATQQGEEPEFGIRR